MPKTIEEINAKIKKGEAVVVNAEEIIKIAKEKGIKQAARDVDVVTTGTFGAMCSSSAYLNIGHSYPRIKLGGGKAYLNEVLAYTGLAATDILIGANALPDDDPRNRNYPGEFNYGGGHVIEELVAGKDVRLSVTAYGTDCYPRKKLETLINIKDINEAILFNPRNAYQNYNAAINLSSKVIYTYMGMLKANMGNINYSTSGQLSPLLNDPYYKTIGIGTKIFLGGGVGFVAYHGTQHNPGAPRNEKGIPTRGAGTLALIGDLKQMDSRWLRGTSMLGYGSTLSIGVGIPIPILSEEILEHVAITDADIVAPIIDYSSDYPNMIANVIKETTYAELKSGKVEVSGKQVPTASLSSYSQALVIANTLKDWIKDGRFLLTNPVEPIPGPLSGLNTKPLKERPIPE
ncbi:MAG: homocysteine biosynthesis protein [Dehalococcoidales bacterium]